MRLIACKMRGQRSNPWLHFAPLAHIESPPEMLSKYFEKALLPKSRLLCGEGMVGVVFTFAKLAADFKNAAKVAKTSSAKMAKQIKWSPMQNTHADTCTSMVPFPINWNPYWRLMRGPLTMFLLAAQQCMRFLWLITAQQQRMQLL